jgi:ketosteroid isomerase-like protein
MPRLPLLALAALLGCATPSSQPAPSPDAGTTSAERAKDRADLLRLHHRARDAHLQRRADWLVSEWADSLFSVSGGGVSISRREEGRAGFQKYLDAVDFQAWDDIAPPRIRISADGQMAYVVVQKRVHLTPRDSAGEPERVRYAWLSVYEKLGGRWRLAAIASTDRPDSL